jgi:group I intron endonuclease
MLIYKATLPNGKSYIGQTQGFLEKRKANHLYVMSRHRYTTIYFYKAIIKYNCWNNIIWEILENNIDNKKELDEKERFFIIKYDTYIPNGYNMSLGGEGNFGYVASEATRQKMSKKQKGKIITEETRKKLSDASKGKKHPWVKVKGMDNPMYGRKHTPEALRRIGDAHRGVHLSKEQREKLSVALKGKKQLNRNIRGERNPMWGRTHSVDTRYKQSSNRSIYLYSAISPENVVFNDINLLQFRKTHSMLKSRIREAAIYNKLYKGWKFMRKLKGSI